MSKDKGSVTGGSRGSKRGNTSSGKKGNNVKVDKKRRKDEMKARLVLRTLRPDDYEDFVALQRRCYPDMVPWLKDQYLTQLETFPEGQLCIELDGMLVANSGSLIVDLDELGSKHTYEQATDRGWFGTHNEEGDTLYGVEMSVHPDYRGLRLSRRMYDARKKLVVEKNLRRLVIGGRMPRYFKWAEQISPEEYLRRVVTKQIRDPVITAQLANGFAVLRLIRDYLLEDKSSRGHAVLMEWLNTKYVPPTGTMAGRGRVRVASVQYEMRRVSSFEEFMTTCEFFIDSAGDFRSDFVIFPELLTTQLFPLLPEGRPGVTARLLDKFTPEYIDFFRRMAIKYAVNIIGGSHLTMEGEDLYNTAYFFRRDGSFERQKKIQITPAEFRWWGVKPGDRLKVFDSDSGKIAILTCYDIEFPELARIAVSKGARILFVPYNTDVRSGHLRVRYCAHARCIENHVYCVLCGATGNLPSVSGADIHYAQSAILTPSDIAFSRDGIGAEANANTETLLVHELDLDDLRRTLRTASVRPWLDRRTDLYRVTYREDDETIEI